MSEQPWLGDAVSLIDTFRSGDLTPTEALDACLGAIEASDLNAFSFLDTDAARQAAATADVSKPLGGLPVGIKELDKVEGWPDTEGSLIFKDRIAGHTSTFVHRLRDAGAVLVGITTASEFGGLNVSVTRLNGITGNPWKPSQTAGGSSGGSASAVMGGLIPIASGGDGGGSIRIPAAFCGAFGLKATYGRIPRGPLAGVYPLTPVLGCLARSVRDTARWFDVCNGFDARDPYSLPRVEGWEAGIGNHDLTGRRMAIIPDLAVATVRPEVADLVQQSGEALAKWAGMELVEIECEMPQLGLEWAMSNIATDLMKELGDLWPDCKDDMTMELAFGIELAHQLYNIEMATKVEVERRLANERMADVFEQVDFLVSATNPDVAYPAEVTLNTRVGDVHVGPENNGALTIPANFVGNPAVSIPIGTVDDLPVGMQVIGRHHEEPLLLEASAVVEREQPWPLVAPGAPI